MKKFLSIFFISVIVAHFASCTVYAYGYFNARATQTQGLAGNGSNEFMKFEAVDGFEELADGFHSNFSDFFIFSPSVVHIVHKGSLDGCLTNENVITHPIYLSNHVLRI